MTKFVQKFSPLKQARLRRSEILKYLKIDTSRYLLGLIVLICLLSMITLGQTGVAATKGYAIAELETRQVELQRERSQLQLRYTTAQSLERIRLRAEQLGLRPTDREQMKYITIDTTKLFEPGKP